MINIDKTKKTAIFTQDGVETDLGVLTTNPKVSVAGLRRRARKLVTAKGLVKAGILVECVVQ